jgi:hypothetical protein
MATPQTSADDRAVRANLELAVLALIAAACLMNLILPAGAPRTIGTLLAALVVPGAAVMTRLPIADLVQGAALMVGMSLTIEVSATLVMVWSGWWHPVGAAIIMVGAAAVVLAVDWSRCVTGSPGAGTQ